MSNIPAPQANIDSRILVQVAAQAAEDKKGEDTRILALDAADSGLADFFLITSATNNRQTLAIADEIELRIKRQYGIYPNSVEGRRQGEWILLDYIDFVVHVFLAEKRAFYDIERLRKSARPLTPAEFDEELKAALAEKTRATRAKSDKVKAKPPATKPAAKKTAPAKAAKKAAAKKTPAKSAKKTPAKPAAKKVAVKKSAAKKSAKKK
ncbi:ribosome silencing factor [Terracidiphilus gabretensis]|uniref:ribosome silencing factor n=1 Tax=Terracidiphilus gabretensis TaxID=1577687 RepID=UPI00071B5955|nr:ribosome silencing factor [Terracidiphilus gabretensis]